MFYCIFLFKYYIQFYWTRNTLFKWIWILILLLISDCRWDNFFFYDLQNTNVRCIFYNSCEFSRCNLHFYFYNVIYCCYTSESVQLNLCMILHVVMVLFFFFWSMVNFLDSYLVFLLYLLSLQNDHRWKSCEILRRAQIFDAKPTCGDIVPTPSTK
jgi:hypothetical protein